MTDVRYDNHAEEWQKCLDEEDRHRVALTWLESKGTLDKWRHDRLYRFIEPLVEKTPEWSWLTVGDGRYGTDANAIISMGAERVVCSDISDTLLKIGNEKGFISEYRAENAENLSFDDDAFDFVFCKEAYHHFPRPHIALHEMLRVGKVGVVLIEPNDSAIERRPLHFLVKSIKKILRGPSSGASHSFEPVGNYVFSVSEREIEKIQLGMHRRFVAFQGLNDYHEPGVEFISMTQPDKRGRKVIRKTKLLITARDLLCKLGLLSNGILVSILFKSVPDASLLKLLKQHGWDVRELPKNPYL